MADINDLLIFAVRGGNHELVKERLTSGANPSYIGDRGCPLLEAIRTKQPEMVRLLIQNGADVNLKDSDGHGVLEWALQTQDRLTIDAVLECGGKLQSYRLHWKEALEKHLKA